MGVTNRQARAEATRHQLLEAARIVFTERGYGATTVASITDGADIAHGTFYLYFRNKEDVFVHVISDVLEEVYQRSLSAIEEAGPEQDLLVLRQRIAGFLEVVVRYGTLWRALLEGAMASPVVEEHWLAQRRRFQQAIAGRWRLRLDGSALDPGLDIDVAANALGSMIEWYAVTGAAFGEPQQLSVDEHVVDTLTQLWWSALGRRS